MGPSPSRMPSEGKHPMSKKIYRALLLCGVAAGLAGCPWIWKKPGASKDDLRQETLRCSRYAQLSYAWSKSRLKPIPETRKVPGTDVIITTSRPPSKYLEISKHLNRCMEEAGYRAVWKSQTKFP